MRKRPKPKTEKKPPPGDARKRKTHLPGNKQHAAAERKRRLLSLLSLGNRGLHWGLREAICPGGLKLAAGAGMASAQRTSGWNQSPLRTPAPTTVASPSASPGRELSPGRKPGRPTDESSQSTGRERPGSLEGPTPRTFFLSSHACRSYPDGPRPRTSVYLGNVASPAPGRRVPLRVGGMVPGPLPGLGQPPVRLRPEPVDGGPHRAGEQGKEEP